MLPLFKRLLIVMLLAVAGQGFAQSPAKRTDAKPTWSLVVLHPSVNGDSLYECVLTIPQSLRVDCVALLLIDRSRTKVGSMLLDNVPEPGGTARSYRFSLNRELVKNSYAQFETYPGEDRGELIKVCPGEHSAVRGKPGRLIQEPID